MLPSIEQKKDGFSLIEILVAAAVLMSITVVSVQFLWDTLTTRAKQQTIENSSDNFRVIANTLTKAIQAAEKVAVLPGQTTLVISGSPDRVVSLSADGQNLEESVGGAPSYTLTKKGITISNLEFSPVGDDLETVTIKIEGVYENSLSKHPFFYQTTVVPRRIL